MEFNDAEEYVHQNVVKTQKFFVFDGKSVNLQKNYLQSANICRKIINIYKKTPNIHRKTANIYRKILIFL